MVCPPVRGDNPQEDYLHAQADNHVIAILYTYINVNLAHKRMFVHGINNFSKHSLGNIFAIF